MRIKSKTCYFCLITAIAYILFFILAFIVESESNDWKIKFLPYLVMLNAFF